MTKKEYQVQKALGTLPLWERIKHNEFEFVITEDERITEFKVPISIGIRVWVDPSWVKAMEISDEDRILTQHYFKHLNDRKRTEKNRQAAIYRIIQHAKDHASLLENFPFVNKCK